MPFLDRALSEHYYNCLRMSYSKNTCCQKTQTPDPETLLLSELNTKEFINEASDCYS